MIVNAYISPWLVVSVFNAAMLLAFMKRKVELTVLKDPQAHRKVFKIYNSELIDQSISIFSFLVLISYSFYILYSPHANPILLFTILLATIVFLRFVSILRKGETSLLRVLSDKTVIICLLLWFLAVFYSIYLHTPSI
ncbi:MAG: hypothetical protein ACUVQ0_03935 [Thermoproteota archaeon]